MYGSHPSFVLGFHGCDESVGMNVLNGKAELKPSSNKWDWLGTGVYFWEHDPDLALEYARNVANGEQFAKGSIKKPFVLGAIIDLGNCWNLTSTGGIEIFKGGHAGLVKTTKIAQTELPKNIDRNQRYLDRAVIEFVHKSNGDRRFDTVRCAFQEGDPVYEGTEITEKNHLQICVCTKRNIRGYFLPHPISKYNPSLKE